MSEAESAGAQPRRRQALWAYLNLAVLWTFAVAQPLFDLLKDNPEFFAARGSSGFDVISFALLLVVVPPALLLGIELLVGLAGAKRARGRSPGAPGRARGADRRAGAQEGLRHLGSAADRAGAGDRRGAGRALRARRAGALVPAGAVARAAGVPRAVPVHRPDLQARLPRRGAGAHDRRRGAGSDRGGAARRAALDHAARRARPDRPGPLPGLRRAGPRRHLVQERLHGLRLHRARAAGDHGRQPAGRRTSCPPPPTIPTASSRCSARPTGCSCPRRPPRSARATSAPTSASTRATARGSAR